jgi:hypothetical protein
MAQDFLLVPLYWLIRIAASAKALISLASPSSNPCEQCRERHGFKALIFDNHCYQENSLGCVQRREYPALLCKEHLGRFLPDISSYEKPADSFQEKNEKERCRLSNKEGAYVSRE